MLNAWLIRHNAWIYSRFQRCEWGQTAFQELKGVAYTSELVPSGETVAGHFPQKHPKRMESDWHLGIWVGRTSTSNEHILVTQGGVLRCRSSRRVELEESYDKRIMENAKGQPWDQGPPRDHADGGPFEGREPLRGTGMLGNKTRSSPHGGLQSKRTSGKIDGTQKRRKHRDKSHQNQRRSQQPHQRAKYILPQSHMEVNQCDDDFFARQDQNMNGPNWMTTPSR